MSIFGWDFDETEREIKRERASVKDARQVISGVKVRRGTCPQSHTSTRSQVSLKRALTHAPSLSLSLFPSLSFLSLSVWLSALGQVGHFFAASSLCMANGNVIKTSQRARQQFSSSSVVACSGWVLEVCVKVCVLICVL